MAYAPVPRPHGSRPRNCCPGKWTNWATGLSDVPCDKPVVDALMTFIVTVDENWHAALTKQAFGAMEQKRAPSRCGKPYLGESPR